MEKSQPNSRQINSLPKGGILVQDGKLWLNILKGIDVDKNRHPKTYTHKEVQKITDVKKAPLNHLVQTSTIIPYDEQKGRGARSTYDSTNLLEVMFCREMRKLSIGIHILKNQLEWLRSMVWEFDFRAFWYQSSSILAKECVLPPYSDDESMKITNEVFKKIERGDLPGEIKRTHTIWEYLRIYGFGTFYFVFGNAPINRKETDENYMRSSSYVADLCEAVDLSDVIKNKVGSIVINLSELKREIDFFQRG